MRSSAMKNKYLMAVILISLSVFVYSNKLEFVSIECPDEVVISEDLSLKDLTIEYLIKYMYLGKEILIKSNEDMNESKSSQNFIYRDFKTKGRIYFIDNEGKILPGALKRSKECGMDFCIGRESTSSSYDCEFVAYENGKEYSWSLLLLDEWIFDQTDIDEAILNKALSAIVIILERIKVSWEVECRKYNSKGELELGDINRAKIIRIRYNGK
jgi:hypothetical protein